MVFRKCQYLYYFAYFPFQTWIILKFCLLRSSTAFLTSHSHKMSIFPVSLKRGIIRTPSAFPSSNTQHLYFPPSFLLPFCLRGSRSWILLKTHFSGHGLAISFDLPPDLAPLFTLCSFSETSNFLLTPVYLPQP